MSSLTIVYLAFKILKVNIKYKIRPLWPWKVSQVTAHLLITTASHIPLYYLSEGQFSYPHIALTCFLLIFVIDLHIPWDNTQVWQCDRSSRKQYHIDPFIHDISDSLLWISVKFYTYILYGIPHYKCYYMYQGKMIVAPYLHVCV